MGYLVIEPGSRIVNIYDIFSNLYSSSWAGSSSYIVLLLVCGVGYPRILEGTDVNGMRDLFGLLRLVR